LHVIANRLQEGGAAPHRLQRTTNDPGSVEPRRTCTHYHSTRRKASPKQLSADGNSLWGYRRRSRIGSIPWPVPDRGAWNPARPRPRSSTQDPRRASEKNRLEGRITPVLLTRCGARPEAQQKLSPQVREDTGIYVLPSLPSTGYSRFPHILSTRANYTLSPEGSSEKHVCRLGFPKGEPRYTGGVRDAPDGVAGCLGFPAD